MVAQHYSYDKLRPFGSVDTHVFWLMFGFIRYMAMDQYLLIPFLGDEHPFTSYFDVHQGYQGFDPLPYNLLMGV